MIQAMGLDFLGPPSQTFVIIALLAWTITFVALVRSLLRRFGLLVSTTAP